MTTWRALVLSGGGVTGELQVGALQALKDRVPHIDMFCGNGVGSLHTTLLAQEDTFEASAQAVIDLWDHDVKGDSSLFLKPFFGLAAGALWSLISSDAWASDSAVSTAPLRALIQKRSSWERISKKRNWAIGSTSLSDGSVYTVSTDPELIEASTTPQMLKLSLDPADPHFIGTHFVDFVQAGAAVPLMFPPVTIWNHRFAEGGVKHYTPVSMAAKALALAVKRDPGLDAAEVFIVDTWGDQAAWLEPKQLNTGQEILVRSLQLMVSQLAHGDLDLGMRELRDAFPKVKITLIRPVQEFQGFTMGFDDMNQRQLLRKRGFALAKAALGV
jgi:predicted acylesterase/phospholipase RssA